MSSLLNFEFLAVVNLGTILLHLMLILLHLMLIPLCPASGPYTGARSKALGILMLVLMLLLTVVAAIADIVFLAVRLVH